jgi:GNAT superfamily N-acetyltransferase
MKTTTELVALANRSYVDSYRKLVAHIPDGAATELGGVFAFATGVPHSLFNGCVVVQPASRTDLEAGLSWIRVRDVPYRVWIDEDRAPGLVGVAIAHGLVPDAHRYPGMVLHPAPDPPPPSPGVQVVPVADGGLDEHLAVRMADGMPPNVASRLFSASFAADPNVEVFTIRLNGRAVGASIAIRTDEVVGVYAVGTLPDARRHGVGTAATWACVAAGRARGCDTIALQASDMGLPIYTAMGFRTVAEYTVFRQPAPG